MWQIQNRDEVNVIESPVMNLGRVELSVFNSNDCTFVIFCMLLFYTESAFLFGSDCKICKISIDGLLLEILDS